MNQDHAIVTGKEHFVCEDYAASGVDAGGRPYVLVADGCSGSPQTDIGARLLVKSAEIFVREWECAPDAGVYHYEAAARALSVASKLSLSPMCCDATLLTAKVVGEEFIVHVCGDGVVALKPKGGPPVYHVITYVVDEDAPPGTDNLQGYASYLTRPDLYSKFMEYPHHKQIETFRYVGGGQNEYVSTVSAQPESKFFSTFGGLVEDFEWVALMSDGAESHVRMVRAGGGNVKEIVPFVDVAERLLAFKNFGGPFVQRRLNRFERDIAKGPDVWFHEDDLSLGVIRF